MSGRDSLAEPVRYLARARRDVVTEEIGCYTIHNAILFHANLAAKPTERDTHHRSPLTHSSLLSPPRTYLSYFLKRDIDRLSHQNIKTPYQQSTMCDHDH